MPPGNPCRRGCRRGSTWQGSALLTDATTAAGMTGRTILPLACWPRLTARRRGSATSFRRGQKARCASRIAFRQLRQFPLPMRFPRAFFTDLSTAHESLFTSRSGFGRYLGRWTRLPPVGQKLQPTGVLPTTGRCHGWAVSDRKTADIQGKPSTFEM